MKKRILSIFMALLLVFSSTVHSVRANDIPVEIVSNNGQIEDTQTRAVVQLKEGVNLQRVLKKINSLKNTKIRNEYDTVFNGFSVDLPKSFIPKLKLWSEVLDIREVEMYYPLMASSKSFAQVNEAIKSFNNNGEGIVVSVIDSGIDVNHKDLQKLDHPEKAKIKAPIIDPKNKDTKFNMKVPYGYNFSDKSYILYSPKNNHGQHVAGIVGANSTDNEVANKTGIDGVASDVQILAMKVFSNNLDMKGAAGDDIIAAIEKSVELKADIINMSLGSDAGFMDDNDPMQRAINKANEEGTLVVVSAGNSQTNFTKTSFSTTPLNVTKRDDFGIVGSPSTAKGAISIASYENTNKFINLFEYMLDGKKITGEFSVAQGNLVEEDHNFVSVGFGKEEDYKDIKDIAGKFVLIQRGEITFKEKVERAHEHNAGGVLVYNNEDGRFGMDLSGVQTKLFAASITKAEGESILELIKSNPNGKIRLHKDMVQVENELKNDMSSFTSWGTTPDLDFKPELTGIGGNVYSTDNNDKYVMMSGTSMSAPYVSGASSIVISQLKKDLPNISNYGEFTKKSLMNSALVLDNTKLKDKLPYSPRRQGAGLIQVKDAIENRVLITDVKTNSAATELRSFSGKKEFEVKLKNYGKEIVSFNVKARKPQTTVQKEDGIFEVVSPAKISTKTKKITLLPGKEKTVKFEIDATNVVNDFVEGYIDFETLTVFQPSLTFPYMGYAGNWNQEPILDDINTLENPKDTLYDSTKLITILEDKFSLMDSTTIVNVGIPLEQKTPVEKYMSFSPGIDGYADIVIPQIGVLRNAHNLRFDVLDENKNVITKLDELNNVRKQSYEDYLSKVKKKEMFLVNPFSEGAWDGKKYNSKTGKKEQLPDGQYYIRVSAKITESSDPQQILFPVKIDTQLPKIKIIKTEEGKEYEVTKEGRVISFKVEDNVGAMLVYAKSGKNRIFPKLDDKGVYKLVIPFSIKNSEDFTLHASDYAYNQTLYEVKGVSGNKLGIQNWKNIIDKKISFLGEYVSGTVKNNDTKKIKIEFEDKKTKEKTSSSIAKVINNKFSFLQFILKEQGRYDAVAIELDDKDTELSRTPLGEVIYDYTAPAIEFNYSRVIDKKEEQKRPEELKKYSNNYVEYEMKLNPDGTATYEGKVNDNVFEPKELKLTIGSRSNVVKINDDGTFKYVLKTPSIKYFDFINITQPAANQVEVSSNIDALDLAVNPKQTGETPKGKEKHYLVTKYIESNEKKKEAEFNLNITKSLTLGSVNIIDPSNNKKDIDKVVKKVGDKYYLDLNGYTNKTNVKVFIDGVETKLIPITEGGRFEKEVELTQGINTFNVRVEDQDGNVLADRKVRVFFDVNLPELNIESPDKNSFIDEEVVTENNEKIIVKYIQTDKDSIQFKGTVRDNGFGYEFRINDNHVLSYSNKNAAGDEKFGENIKAFDVSIDVEDGDFITLSLKDKNKNSTEFKYVVRKVEKSLEKNVVLSEKIEKLVGQEFSIADLILENPDNYDVIIDSENISTEKPGEFEIKGRIVYDAANIVEFTTKLVVTNDKTLLKEAIQESYRILLENNKFTKNSILTLEKATKYAKSINDLNFATKVEIDKAIKDIKDAISNLEKVYDSKFVSSIYIVDKGSIQQKLVKTINANSESELINMINTNLKDLKSQDFAVFDYERIFDDETKSVEFNYYLIKVENNSKISSEIDNEENNKVETDKETVSETEKEIVKETVIENEKETVIESITESLKETAKETAEETIKELPVSKEKLDKTSNMLVNSNSNGNNNIVDNNVSIKRNVEKSNVNNPNTSDEGVIKEITIILVMGLALLLLRKKQSHKN